MSDFSPLCSSPPSLFFFTDLCLSLILLSLSLVSILLPSSLSFSSHIYLTLCPLSIDLSFSVFLPSSLSSSPPLSLSPLLSVF